MVTHKYEHEKDRATFLALHQVTLDIKAELKRAAFKHGMHQTPANPDQTDESNLKVLVEECGEAAELLLRLGNVARYMTYDEGDKEKLEAELIQVACMASAWVVGIRLRQIEGDV
jgi:NTP pyrophosphatase (non-canonical NTP hydrolase)